MIAFRFNRDGNDRDGNDRAGGLPLLDVRGVGFIYDEAEGLPEDGIAAGTRWEDIPDSSGCPDCGVTKSDFELMPVN